MKEDIFRPLHDPARSIYDAFQAEATKRKGRSVEEWQTLEREAVLNAAVYQAHILGLNIPTIADVLNAETSAMGHCDYGSKWAYGVVRAMKELKA
jgi:hypothetical protein